MEPESNDNERLWAIVGAARAVTSASSGGKHECDDAYADVMHALKASPWQLNRALNFQPKMKTWFDRAHVYFRLRRQIKLLTDERDSSDQKQTIEELTKSLGLLEYGAAVNETWYRRLEGLVASGVTAQGNLQSLLGSAEVGTRSNGDLEINRFHKGTRLLIGAFLIFWLFVCFVMLIEGIAQIHKHGFLRPEPWYFFSYLLITAIPAWGGWWAGPASWMASMKLQRLFGRHADGIATAHR